MAIPLCVYNVIYRAQYQVQETAVATLAHRGQFIGADDGAYLSTPGDGLVPRSALNATVRYFKDKANGPSGRVAQTSVAERVKRQLCELLTGADPGDLALLGSSSEGVNAIYELIDWQPGDNVVLMTNDLEFPSVVLPAVKREAGGLEIRVVDRDDWHVTEDAIAAAVDTRTRLVFVSHVSYRTGYRVDIERLAALLHTSDAILAVDATQSLGILPVPADACDFMVATTCKWLLGPHGLGVFYWNRRRRPNITPTRIGWYSVVDDLQFPYELRPDAERFELGGPNMLGIYALDAGLQVLTQHGIEAIWQHADQLADLGRSEIAARGYPLMTVDDLERRSGIVAWEDDDNAATARRLAEHGVLVTGSSGRVRIGFHLYNDKADLERLLAVLERR